MSAKLLVPAGAPDQRNVGAISFPSQVCTAGISPIGEKAGASSVSATRSLPRHPIPCIADRALDRIPRAFSAALERVPAALQLRFHVVPALAAMLSRRVVSVAVRG